MTADDALADAMQSHGATLRSLARAILRDAEGADAAVVAGRTTTVRLTNLR